MLRRKRAAYTPRMGATSTPRSPWPAGLLLAPLAVRAGNDGGGIDDGLILLLAALALMLALGIGLSAFFWRKRYLSSHH